MDQSILQDKISKSSKLIKDYIKDLEERNKLLLERITNLQEEIKQSHGNLDNTRITYRNCVSLCNTEIGLPENSKVYFNMDPTRQDRFKHISIYFDKLDKQSDNLYVSGEEELIVLPCAYNVIKLKLKER